MYWNLFLAWIPYWVGRLFPAKGFGPRFWLVGAIWLLFLPNTFYAITDLTHFRDMAGIARWYDVALYAGYIWVGASLGLASLWDFQSHLRRSIGSLGSTLAAHGVLLLSTIGVYFGRFLRLNSWDAATHPRVLKEAFGRLQNYEVVGFVILYYLLYAVIYEIYCETARRTPEPTAVSR
jgi:uncharacterized membrane protein